jgi:hypothetical protein
MVVSVLKVWSQFCFIKRWLQTHLSKYCGIFAQGKNCGARETGVASEWLWNNICFLAMAGKQTTEQRPLLGNRFLISDNWKSTIEQATEEWCFLCVPHLDVLTGTVWGNQSVARILSWKEATIQRGLGPRSRGISIVRSRYQEMTSGDCNRLRTLVCVL